MSHLKFLICQVEQGEPICTASSAPGFQVVSDSLGLPGPMGDTLGKAGQQTHEWERSRSLCFNGVRIRQQLLEP